MTLAGTKVGIRLSCRADGEYAADGGAFVDFGVEFHVSAHGGYGVFDDGEAESCAAVGAAAGAIDGVESLEDSLLVFEWEFRIRCLRLPGRIFGN